MAKQNEMSLMTFQKKFHSNESCRKHLFKLKWPNGFKCPICGHNHYSYLVKKKLYQCSKCHHQTSVTANTVFHGSKIPLKKWFWAIYLISRDKGGISAMSLKKHLGIAYQTAWTMLQKIRHSMNLQDSNYKLENIVEMDEAYIGGKKTGGKRGRGTDKNKVIVEVSLNDEGKPQFARLRLVPDIKASVINKTAINDIVRGSNIVSDNYSIYNGLEYAGFNHAVVSPDVSLSWLNVVISNVKTFLKGTYHGACSTKHLQKYLDEYCYRFNRRFWESQLFNRLLSACSKSRSQTIADLFG